jgi:hypothetical protein
MKEIKPCPDECTFDWSDFHTKLDVAFAHFIEEQDGRLTSPIFDLLRYSFAKKNSAADIESIPPSPSSDGELDDDQR